MGLLVWTCHPTRGAVHTRGSGYTRAQVLAALQSIAESIGYTLLVLPLPAATAGELLLLHVAVELDTL